LETARIHAPVSTQATRAHLSASLSRRCSTAASRSLTLLSLEHRRICGSAPSLRLSCCCSLDRSLSCPPPGSAAAAADDPGGAARCPPTPDLAGMRGEVAQWSSWLVPYHFPLFHLQSLCISDYFWLDEDALLRASASAPRRPRNIELLYLNTKSLFGYLQSIWIGGD
jgi:hypothetical protein